MLDNVIKSHTSKWFVRFSVVVTVASNRIDTDMQINQYVFIWSPGQTLLCSHERSPPALTSGSASPGGPRWTGSGHHCSGIKGHKCINQHKPVAGGEVLWVRGRLAGRPPYLVPTPDKLSLSSTAARRTCSSLSICSLSRSSSSCIIIRPSSGRGPALEDILERQRQDVTPQKRHTLEVHIFFHYFLLWMLMMWDGWSD